MKVIASLAAAAAVLMTASGAQACLTPPPDFVPLTLEQVRAGATARQAQLWTASPAVLEVAISLPGEPPIGQESMTVTTVRALKGEGAAGHELTLSRSTGPGCVWGPTLAQLDQASHGERWIVFAATSKPRDWGDIYDAWLVEDVGAPEVRAALSGGVAAGSAAGS